MGLEHVLRPRGLRVSRAPAEWSVLTRASSHSGWVTALVVVGSKPAVAVLMLLVALLFTGIAVLGIVMLKRIHSLYRQTGASFQKAQQEFAAGVFSNPAVRTAAANAAAGAAENAFRAP